MLDQYQDDLKDIVYEFFMKFSRFEFALKESGFVRAGHRDSVQSDWGAFHNQFEAEYVLSDFEQEILDAPPKVQVFRNGNIHWQDFQFQERLSNLEQLTLALRAMRNNLFHGGKYGHRSWDDYERVKFLIERGVKTIDKLASLGDDLPAHYAGRY